MGIKLASWKSISCRAGASDFKSSLKLKIYSQALCATPAVEFARALDSGCEAAVVAPGLESCQLWSYGNSLIPWLSKCSACSRCISSLHMDAAWTWCCLALTQQRLQSLTRAGIVYLPPFSLLGGLDDWEGKCWSMKWIWHWCQENIQILKFLNLM